MQKEVRTAADNAEFYVRNTLYLALSLFLVGISRMFSTTGVRLALQVMAVVLLLFGIFNIATGPIA